MEDKDLTLVYVNLRKRADYYKKRARKEPNPFIGAHYKAVGLTLDEVADAIEDLESS